MSLVWRRSLVLPTVIAAGSPRGCSAGICLKDSTSTEKPREKCQTRTRTISQKPSASHYYYIWERKDLLVKRVDVRPQASYLKRYHFSTQCQTCFNPCYLCPPFWVTLLSSPLAIFLTSSNRFSSFLFSPYRLLLLRTNLSV